MGGVCQVPQECRGAGHWEDESKQIRERKEGWPLFIPSHFSPGYRLHSDLGEGALGRRKSSNSTKHCALETFISLTFQNKSLKSKSYRYHSVNVETGLGSYSYLPKVKGLKPTLAWCRLPKPIL